jgi:hypothetical protein
MEVAQRVREAKVKEINAEYKDFKSFEQQIKELKSNGSADIKNVLKRTEAKFRRFTKNTGYYDKANKVTQIKDEINKIEKMSNYEMYKHLFGEMESRNVQKRIDMTIKQRKETPIDSTLDVDKYKAIHYTKDGVETGSTKLEDYVGVHTAPNKQNGDESLRNIEEMMPDITGKDGWRYYGHGGDSVAMDKETARIIRDAVANPDKKITMYRAVPKGIKTINDGDWVSINKQYVKEHGESHLDDGFEIISKDVSIDELFTDGNSIHEFGYSKQ